MFAQADSKTKLKKESIHSSVGTEYLSRIQFDTILCQISTKQLALISILISERIETSSKFLQSKSNLRLGRDSGCNQSLLRTERTPRNSTAKRKKISHVAVKARVFCVFDKKQHQQEFHDFPKNEKLLNY